MRKIKKSIGILLAISMLVSLCACGGTSGTQGNETTEQLKEKTTESGDSSSEEQVTLDLFVNHTWWPLQSWSGSVPEYITDQTGVNIRSSFRL